MPDTAFPFDIWQRLSTRAARQIARRTVQERDPAGEFALRQAIANHVSFVRAVACTPDDIVVTGGTRQAIDLIARILVTPGARIVSVIPSHQFPLGVAMSAARRAALLDFAASFGAVIVEDDYDSEFRHDSLPLDALQTLDRAEPAFYVGTFSKSMFPELRGCGRTRSPSSS